VMEAMKVYTDDDAATYHSCDVPLDMFFENLRTHHTWGSVSSHVLPSATFNIFE
jgi:hypothetical protein